MSTWVRNAKPPSDDDMLDDWESLFQELAPLEPDLPRYKVGLSLGDARRRTVFLCPSHSRPVEFTTFVVY